MGPDMQCKLDGVNVTLAARLPCMLEVGFLSCAFLDISIHMSPDRRGQKGQWWWQQGRGRVCLGGPLVSYAIHLNLLTGTQGSA